MNETERKALFRVNRMAEGFLSTMLQDMQHSEADEAYTDGREERDTGTIYTCPDATLRAVLKFTDDFRARISDRPVLAVLMDSATTFEALGSDLYLEMAGHGAGFRDRRHYREDRRANDIIGDALHIAAALTRRAFFNAGDLEAYLGDDGGAYICGSENA